MKHIKANTRTLNYHAYKTDSVFVNI